MERACCLARDLKCRDRYPGVWDIFGGHIEDKETTYEALCREMREELGIEVLARISQRK